MEKILIWENPSPTSSFVNQTIILSLLAYDIVEIEFVDGKSFDISVGLSDMFYDKISDMVAYARSFDLSDNKIIIGEGLMHYINKTSFSISNKTLIPYKIYGMKYLD